jgi:hypothetical protein
MTEKKVMDMGVEFIYINDKLVFQNQTKEAQRMLYNIQEGKLKSMRIEVECIICGQQVYAINILSHINGCLKRKRELQE